MNMTKFRQRLLELYNEQKDKNHRFGRKDFAEYLGVSIGKSNSWLDGNGRPTFELLVEIADHLNVSVSWLLGQIDERTVVVPSNCVELPAAATEDYKFMLQFLRFKYHFKEQVETTEPRKIE